MKERSLVLTLVASLLGWAGLTCAQAGQLKPGTPSPGLSSTAGGDSFAPTFSADGRWVVFLSYAKNLVANDDEAPHLDLFVHDLLTTNTLFVSVNRSGISGGNADAHSPSISSNGQFIAFESAADNLVPGDTNGVPDVFVRDIAGSTTALVSIGAFGVAGTNGASSNPLISHDGSRIVFESIAANLVANDTNGVADVFQRNLATGMTVLVSDSAMAAGPGIGPCGSPAVSPDGRFVAFTRMASNAMPAASTSSFSEVYLRDLQSGITTWISASMANRFPGALHGFSCFNPTVSTDGRFVAFLAAERFATSAMLFRHDTLTGTNIVVISNVPPGYVPQMSANGRFLVAHGQQFLSSGPTGLHVWDGDTAFLRTICSDSSFSDPTSSCGSSPVFAANANTFAYIGSFNGIGTCTWPTWSGPAAILSTNGMVRFARNLSEPAISGNGLRVAFESAADDLVADDLNLASDIFVRDMPTSTTRLISRRHPLLPSFTTVAQVSLARPALSANGSVIAFATEDNLLVSYDTNAVPDLLVRNLSTGSNYLAGAGFVIVRGDGGIISPFTTNLSLPKSPSSKPVLSADGRFIAFQRSEVVPGDSFTMPNVYRQDLDAGTWTRVNRPQPTAATFVNGAEPAMSPDGRFVAFQSFGRAGDLDGLFTVDLFTTLDVFVRDMAATNLLTRTVSLSTNGQAGTGESRNPVFSPDGRWIAFESTSRVLVTNSVLGGSQLFARHLATAQTRLVSFRPDGAGMAGGTNPVFSADSRFVVFQEFASFIVTVSAIHRHDLAAVGRVTNDFVCTNCSSPTVSANGRWVAYETRGTAVVSQVVSQIIVKDMLTGETNLVSASASGSGGGNGPSSAPQISYDGHYVVFTSTASDLVGNDTNGMTDVFVHDRWSGTTLLASINAQGTASGNGPSASPVMAADGRTVAFLSHASDLLTGDFNDKRDVFLLRLGAPDTDLDGMEDDWEMAYFSSLTRDGRADFDSDGVNDLGEFRAGTDPLDTGSVLRVLTLTAPLNGAKTLLWSAVPGRTYRVQFKSVVDSTLWTDLPGEVTAVGTTASKADGDAGTTSNRFYRVLVAQ